MEQATPHPEKVLASCQFVITPMRVSKESFAKRSLGQAAALLCVQQQRGSLETELCKPSLDFWQKP